MKITRHFRHKWEDKDVEKHWDKVASIYIEENNKVKNAHDQRFVESLDHLQISKGMKILNISSRDAEANDYILKSVKEVDVVNAEISQGLIEEAKKFRPDYEYLKLNTYSSLPLADGTFDRILSLETLEHVSEPIRFLEELYRVSKPGAIMVLSCPPSSAEPAYRVFTFLFGGHGEGPHRFPHPKEVKEMLKITRWNVKKNYGSLLLPVGPVFLQNWGEKIIRTFSGTWIENLGIRQFFICERS